METFDSHTRLNDVPFRGREEIYLDRTQESGVVESAIAEQDPEFNERAVNLSQRFNNLYAIIDYCPDVAKDYNQKSEDKLIEQLKRPETIALGKIGLDYYWDESPGDVQRKVFAQQFDLTHSLKMPINVHTRDAFEDTCQVLKDSHVGEYGGMIHNFNGDPDWLKKFLDLGMMVSFSGVVSFTKIVDVHASAKVIPWNEFLVETDVPYLAPEPYREERNETGYVRYVAEAITELRDILIEKVAKYAFESMMKAYGIE